jgi:CubicO group peptidase (beta-lactamase class C family)
MHKHYFTMTKIFSICLSAMLLYSCTTSRQSATGSPAQVRDSLTNELNEVYKQGMFNGFSVAIVNESGTLYQSGVGYANVAAGKKYTSNTLQHIASVSKTFIGIALLKAQEMGKLKLDDPINKYLPFKVENPFYPEVPITIRNLATHTSTITDNEFYLKRGWVLKPNQDLTGRKLSLEDEQVLNPYDSVITMQAYLKNVLSKDGKWYKQDDFLKYKSGEIFEYSNVGATLAAYIIELATGESYDKFTEKYILQPLKMNASGWKFSDVDFANHSQLYYTPDTAFAFYSTVTYPDGGLITSANDLGKYLAELIKGYEGHGTLLNKESYRQLFTEQLTAKNFIERKDKNPYNETYNLGIFMGFSVAGNIGHTGGDAGVTTIMFFNPKTKIGRLLIVNTNINDKQGNDEFYSIWDKLEKYQYRLTNATQKK